MAHGGSIVETELKYLGPDLEAVRPRLREGGARLAVPRELETNTILDDSAGSLRSSDRLLRLRNQRELTVKLPIHDDRFKSRREITAMVEGDAIEELLAGLGYQVVFRYEKYREYWELDGLSITLDELPFIGPVVEIEGEPDKIEGIAHRLGLESLPTSTSNYLELFAEYARGNGLPEGSFMTFAAEAAHQG
ncbi:MAG: class IV adenylate cyclase [Candidatus Dormiibacterota bacterium]